MRMNAACSSPSMIVWVLTGVRGAESMVTIPPDPFCCSASAMGGIGDSRSTRKTTTFFEDPSRGRMIGAASIIC